MHFIFDLDHTVIDSSHRQLTKADGSLDLAHWRENCTHQKIMADTLLPLARTMREALENPRQNVIICTARVLGIWDHVFLADNGLLADVILSRPEGDTTPDAELKTRLLKQHCQRVGITWARFTRSAYMFDDNANVLAEMKSQGITALNAIKINQLKVA
jgi:hypothetical protein